MQGWGELLHRDIDHLNERGDHENESDGLEIAHAEGLENEVLQGPGDSRSGGHHEDDRTTHAQCGGELFRHA